MLYFTFCYRVVLLESKQEQKKYVCPKQYDNWCVCIVCMEHFNVIKRFTFCLRCTASGSSLQNVSVAVLLFIPVQHDNDWDTIGPLPTTYSREVATRHLVELVFPVPPPPPPKSQKTLTDLYGKQNKKQK